MTAIQMGITIAVCTAATMLCTEVIRTHTFDITKFCHGNDCICHRDQIFHGDVILIVSDGSTSVITIFCTDDHDFFFDHTKQFFSSARIAFNSAIRAIRSLYSASSFSRSRPVSALSRISTIA